MGGPDTIRDHRGSTLWSKQTVWAGKNFRPWLAFTGLKAAGGSWGARHHQGPSGINAEVKRNQLSQKKFRPRSASGGLGQPQGPRWGRMLSGTIRDRRWRQKEPIKPKKISASSGLGQPRATSRTREGARHGRGPSGIDAEVKRNRMRQKKKFGQITYMNKWNFEFFLSVLE